VENTFVFSRPRGIEGNFAVEITLELLPMQESIIIVQQSSPQSGMNSHKPVLREVKVEKLCEEENGCRVVRYTIGRIVAGDTITVDMQGGVSDPRQRIVYTATMQGFAIRRVACHTDTNTWLDDSSTIALMDRDAREDNGQEEGTSSSVALQVLDVRHGFQIRRLVGTVNEVEDAPQTLLEGILVELSSRHRPMARLVSPKKRR